MSRLSQLRVRRQVLLGEAAASRRAAQATARRGRGWLASLSLGLMAARVLAGAQDKDGNARAGVLGVLDGLGSAARRHPWLGLALGAAAAWLWLRRAGS